MQVIKLRVKPCVSTLKKDDDKEMMADIASVILLLAVSEERLQQIMEAKEVDSVFRQITTYCFKKWPDKHSLIKKDAIKPTGSTSGTLYCTDPGGFKRIVIPTSV